MYRYILNLYKQYCDSMGIICEPLNINELPNGFVEWLAKNKMLSNKYRDYLTSLGYCNGKLVYEIGKGRFDTISSDKTRIISPYGETVGYKNTNLFIVGNTPLIQSADLIVIPNTNVFLTHNPYEEMSIENWIRIHNTGLYDISIGIYGSVHDEDFNKKVKMIEALSQNMTDDHVVNYDTEKDNFFCSLNSKRNTKTRVKTLIR